MFPMPTADFVRARLREIERQVRWAAWREPFGQPTHRAGSRGCWPWSRVAKAPVRGLLSSNRATGRASPAHRRRSRDPSCHRRAVVPPATHRQHRHRCLEQRASGYVSSRNGTRPSATSRNASRSVASAIALLVGFPAPWPAEVRSL